MKKNTPIIIILIALFFTGWILAESGAFPFVAWEADQPAGPSVDVDETPLSPVVANPAADKCYVGGCSNQICSDEEGMVSTCEFRPEYSCYQGAKCERQESGQCGWTVTAELSMCLQNASL